MTSVQATIENRPSRQHLDRPASDQHQVFRDLICFQAQNENAARLSLALRLEDEKAITAETTVRTWNLRGTMHLAEAADAEALVLIARERNDKETNRVLANHGLSPSEVSQVRDLVTHILLDNELTSRETFYDAVATRHGTRIADEAITPWGGVLKLVASQYLLHATKPQGAQTHFRVVRELPSLSSVDALAQFGQGLLSRFDLGYRPTASEHFAQWVGVSKSSLKKAAGKKPTAAGASASFRKADLHVVILPEFDPYVISHASREAIFPDSRILRGTVRKAGWISSCILVDGVIRGFRNPGRPVAFSVEKEVAQHVSAAYPDIRLHALT